MNCQDTTTLAQGRKARREQDLTVHCSDATGKISQLECIISTFLSYKKPTKLPLLLRDCKNVIFSCPAKWRMAAAADMYPITGRQLIPTRVSFIHFIYGADGIKKPMLWKPRLCEKQFFSQFYYRGWEHAWKCIPRHFVENIGRTRRVDRFCA